MGLSMGFCCCDGPLCYVDQCGNTFQIPSQEPPFVHREGAFDYQIDALGFGEVSTGHDVSPSRNYAPSAIQQIDCKCVPTPSWLVYDFGLDVWDFETAASKTVNTTSGTELIDASGAQPIYKFGSFAKSARIELPNGFDPGFGSRLADLFSRPVSGSRVAAFFGTNPARIEVIGKPSMSFPFGATTNVILTYNATMTWSVSATGELTRTESYTAHAEAVGANGRQYLTSTGTATTSGTGSAANHIVSNAELQGYNRTATRNHPPRRTCGHIAGVVTGRVLGAATNVLMEAVIETHVGSSDDRIAPCPPPAEE